MDAFETAWDNFLEGIIESGIAPADAPLAGVVSLLVILGVTVLALGLLLRSRRRPPKPPNWMR